MSDRDFISAGWWGYFLCATIYLISGLRSGDWLGLAGSAFFLIATVLFMVPHYRKLKSTRQHKDRHDG